ncbi:MAG: SurA N-terminal domain-containing protein, partial [Hyphomicrobiales bacterium]
MMDGLRKAGNSWIGRIVLTIMFGILIFSFALWGIGDIFKGYGMKTVAKVGNTEIDAQVYKQAFQAELQVLSRRYGQNITADRAIAFGLDRQVLQRMISDAALDDRARTMKLGLSDTAIANALLSDPNFIGADGKFDRARFNEALRASGYSEAGFISEQRALDLRQHIIQGLSGVATPPSLVTDAMSRFTTEERSISYIVISKTQVGESTIPDDAVLTKFFEENKANFKAPEYRKFVFASLDPLKLADPASIPDADVKARYEADRETIYTSQEKRSLRQIVFTKEDEAKTAYEKIASGSSFDDLVTERKLSAADTDIGVIEKRMIADKAVADAAFSLEKGKVSDVIKGQFGFVIVTVSDITPATTQSFETVADSIKIKLATEKAKTSIRDLHDKIEDQRAAAKPLAEIAKDNNLALVTIDAADRLGLSNDGASIPALDGQNQLINAVFASDVGVDNEAVTLRTGGYIWFDVLGITPPRDRSFDEAKEKVVNAWREDDLAKRLQAKADELVQAVKSGKSIATLASELGLDAKDAKALKRSAQSEGVSPKAVSAAFGVPVTEATSALGNNPDERIILTVDSSALGDSATALADAGRIADQMRRSLSDDYANAYVLRTQQDLGVTVNDRVR